MSDYEDYLRDVSDAVREAFDSLPAEWQNLLAGKDTVRPGDIRIDLENPAQCLYIVAVIKPEHAQPGEQWFETNVGAVEWARIGALIDHQDIATWKGA